jgi:CPA2 family monovalent cation:H+ antiporter-2
VSLDGASKSMLHETWLKDLFVFLVAAGLIVPLFHRARIGAVLGFLLIGVAVGPHGFGQLAADYPWVLYLTIEDRARAEPFAELGVMFLLFLIGIEMSVRRLWSLRRYVAGIGSVQFVATAVVIGIGMRVLGASGTASIILGLALAMSSTAVVMQLLEEQGRSATPLGQVAIAVLLFQDLMVAPSLFGTEILARGGGDIQFWLAIAILQAAIAVVAILIIGRYALRPLFSFAARTSSRELIMAITLLMVIGVAAATAAVGLSTALGAFLAGVLLSETEYQHQIEVDIAPFKGLLIGLFFITVGMTFDLRIVWQSIDKVSAGVVLLLAAKALILYLASRLFAVRNGVAIEAAMLLAQAGEFGFVVIKLGQANGLIEGDVAHTTTAAIAISMIATPLLAVGARALAGRIQQIEHRDNLPDYQELCEHVIIGGYGRVGQTVARMLVAENVPFVALDSNAELVAEHRDKNVSVFFGDAARREFLQRAGARQARAFLVTVNSARAAERMVAAAH